MPLTIQNKLIRSCDGDTAQTNDENQFARNELRHKCQGRLYVGAVVSINTSGRAPVAGGCYSCGSDCWRGSKADPLRPTAFVAVVAIDGISLGTLYSS